MNDEFYHLFKEADMFMLTLNRKINVNGTEYKLTREIIQEYKKSGHIKYYSNFSDPWIDIKLSEKGKMILEMYEL